MAEQGFTAVSMAIGKRGCGIEKTGRLISNPHCNDPEHINRSPPVTFFIYHLFFLEKICYTSG